MTYEDPYWSHDAEIGLAPFDGEVRGVRLKLHESHERYTEGRELVPVAGRGERVYYHARPYILLPDITLTARLSGATGSIGKVLSGEYTGVRTQEIGNCQGWYYPADRTLVLWECLLGDRYRHEEPIRDEALRVLWEGFERCLLKRVPDARRIITPNWEPEYEQGAWQRFLGERGYAPVAQEAYGKEVGRATR